MKEGPQKSLFWDKEKRENREVIEERKGWENYGNGKLATNRGVGEGEDEGGGPGDRLRTESWRFI